jgi:catechol 2,3-dioxygenase-like lactoylglutathione lyase family enzyme
MPKLTRLVPMLRAADLRQTIDFYTRILDFALLNAWPADKPTWCCLARDAVEIMFTTGDDLAQIAQPKMTGVLYLNTDEVLALHARIKDHVTIRWGLEIYHYGMHEFAIEDCDGYTLSFGQATDLAATCPAE